MQFGRCKFGVCKDISSWRLLPSSLMIDLLCTRNVPILQIVHPSIKLGASHSLDVLPNQLEIITPPSVSIKYRERVLGVIPPDADCSVESSSIRRLSLYK